MRVARTDPLSFGMLRVVLPQQPRRGVKTLDFAGTKETVYERADWPVPKLQEYFKDDTLALIGYGSQGEWGCEGGGGQAGHSWTDGGRRSPCCARVCVSVLCLPPCPSCGFWTA